MIEESNPLGNEQGRLRVEPTGTGVLIFASAANQTANAIIEDVLRDFPGDAVVWDPTGTLRQRTEDVRSTREQGDIGIPRRGRYNPLHHINANDPIPRAQALATAMLDPWSKGLDYRRSAAQTLLYSEMLITTRGGRERRTTCRDLLNGLHGQRKGITAIKIVAGTDIDEWPDRDEAWAQYLHAQLATLQSLESNERDAILRETQNALLPFIGNDVQTKTVVKDPTTVYFCGGLTDPNEAVRFRVYLDWALNRQIENKNKGRSLLAVIPQFTDMGRLNAVATAMPFLERYATSVILTTENRERIRAVYGRANTLEDNCTLRIADRNDILEDRRPGIVVKVGVLYAKGRTVGTNTGRGSENDEKVTAETDPVDNERAAKTPLPRRIASKKLIPGLRKGGDYWGDFTQRAKRVIGLAQQEAERLGNNYIGTEHILLGIVVESQSLAAKVLESMGASLEKVRHEIEAIVGYGTKTVQQEMVFTPRSKRVLELAYDEANHLNHNYIGTEHLLLGLSREGEGVAARVLTNLGIETTMLRKKTTEVIGGQTDATETDEFPPSDEHKPTSYTWNAWEVMVLAEEEARDAGSPRIGQEHLLIGVLAQQNNAGAHFITALGGTLSRARAELKQRTGKSKRNEERDLPWTPSALRTMECVHEERRRLKTDVIGTDLLVLGILKLGNGTAYDLLQTMNVDTRRLAEALADRQRDAA